jgi:hypothetical protein
MGDHAGISQLGDGPNRGHGGVVGDDAGGDHLHRGWVRRMGYKRWQKLHRTVDFCGIAGVTHYYLLVKSDIRLPLLYGAILAVLLGYRVIKTPAQPQSSPASRGGSGRLDPARHAQARTQLARKILGTAVIFQVRHETAFVPDGLACLRTGMT